MAIKVNAMAAVRVTGDGASTSIALNLTHVPLSYNNTYPAELVRPDNLPSSVVNISPAGITGVLNGATLTLTWSVAPGNGVGVSVSFELLFPGS